MAAITYPIGTAPFFLQKKPGDGDPITYSAYDMRRYTAATVRRSGVLGYSDLYVTQAPNVGFSIQVYGGYAHLGGTGHDYIAHLGHDQVISLEGFWQSPPWPLDHKVWICVYDALTTAGGTEYSQSIVITQNSDGSGAPAPAGATASLLLATFQIMPNQGNVQNKDITNVAEHGGNSGNHISLVSGILKSGYEDAGALTGTAPFRAVYSNGAVRLSGSIQRSNSAPFPANASYDIGTLKGFLCPKNLTYLTVSCGVTSPHTTVTGTYTCRLRIGADGVMSIYMPSGQTPLYIHFDGVTYDLD